MILIFIDFTERFRRIHYILRGFFCRLRLSLASFNNLLDKSVVLWTVSRPCPRLNSSIASINQIGLKSLCILSSILNGLINIKIRRNNIVCIAHIQPDHLLFAHGSAGLGHLVLPVIECFYVIETRLFVFMQRSSSITNFLKSVCNSQLRINIILATFKPSSAKRYFSLLLQFIREFLGRFKFGVQSFVDLVVCLFNAFKRPYLRIVNTSLSLFF